MSFTAPSAVPTWTLRDWPVLVSVPAGTGVPADWIALAIAEAVSPRLASSSSSGVIVMTCSRVPVTETSLTPDTPLSTGTACSFSLSASRCWSSEEATASCTTGMSSVLPTTACGSTSEGSCGLIRLIACWIWPWAASMSVP